MSCHVKMAFGTSVVWSFLPQFSESTLYGRNGSNACNFIALLLAKFYILCSFIKQIHVTSLKPDKSIYYNCISLGNHLLDSLTTGNVQLEDSFHLSIVNKDPMVPQSSLRFYLERLTKEDNLAAIVITNGMTISLVGKNNNIIVIDGHLHGQLGAIVGTVDKVEELLIFVKQQ